MSNKNKSAFPLVDNVQTGHIEAGLTKREYFAAMAMQGAMVNADIDSLCAQGAAEVAVNLADALLAALSKESQ